MLFKSRRSFQIPSVEIMTRLPQIYALIQQTHCSVGMRHADRKMDLDGAKRMNISFSSSQIRTLCRSSIDESSSSALPITFLAAACHFPANLLVNDPADNLHILHLFQQVSLPVPSNVLPSELIIVGEH